MLPDRSFELYRKSLDGPGATDLPTLKLVRHAPIVKAALQGYIGRRRDNRLRTRFQYDPPNA